MSEIAIKVENLSKLYHIGEKASGSFRETITNGISRMLRKKAATDETEFWALSDVSFDINRGDVVGIIGKNGAGKSTLLKVLSRITEPTTGKIWITGRVGSLLEVGTGFHPELSGRENIFLNGSILGMRRSEIQSKFDEIVAFSGIEKFIDTPVKRYSSGMYVRLAFAVAAHLEPEILIVDEVLAVGDAEFQKKCLGKMGEVAGKGRTVILVSHNMAAIQNLCTKVIFLKAGKIVASGKTTEIVNQYLEQSFHVKGENGDLLHHPGRVPEKSPNPVFNAIVLKSSAGKIQNGFSLGDDIAISISFTEKFEPMKNIVLKVSIDTLSGQRVLILHSDRIHKGMLNLEPGVTATCLIKNCRLLPGTYKIKLALSKNIGGIAERQDVIEDAATFDIEPSDIYGTGKLSFDRDSGFFAPDASWTLEGN